MSIFEKLFGFLNDKWVDMPSGIKVFTYLTVLASFVYLLFTPQFIDGKVVGVYADSDQEYAIQHEMFELDIEGRTIRFVTNGRGRFAIPKPNKFPFTKVELTFFPEGTENGSPEDLVVLEFADSLMGEAKIYTNNGDFSTNNPVAQSRETRSSILSFLLPSAYAQTGAILPRAENARNVEQQVRTILSKELEGANVSYKSRIEDLKISNRKLSSVLSQVEKSRVL